MTIGEFKEITKDIPDDVEIRLGNFYDEVGYCQRKTVNVNYRAIDCVNISDEEIE